MDLTNATEEELRGFVVPHPKSQDELMAIVNSLAQRQHEVVRE